MPPKLSILGGGVPGFDPAPPPRGEEEKEEEGIDSIAMMAQNDLTLDQIRKFLLRVIDDDVFRAEITQRKNVYRELEQHEKVTRLNKALLDALRLKREKDDRRAAMAKMNHIMGERWNMDQEEAAEMARSTLYLRVLEGEATKAERESLRNSFLDDPDFYHYAREQLETYEAVPIPKMGYWAKSLRRVLSQVDAVQAERQQRMQRLGRASEQGSGREIGGAGSDQAERTAQAALSQDGGAVSMRHSRPRRGRGRGDRGGRGCEGGSRAAGPSGGGQERAVQGNSGPGGSEEGEVRFGGGEQGRGRGEGGRSGGAQGSRPQRDAGRGGGGGAQYRASQAGPVNPILSVSVIKVDAPTIQRFDLIERVANNTATAGEHRSFSKDVQSCLFFQKTVLRLISRYHEHHPEKADNLRQRLILVWALALNGPIPAAAAANNTSGAGAASSASAASLLSRGEAGGAAQPWRIEDVVALADPGKLFKHWHRFSSNALDSL